MTKINDEEMEVKTTEDVKTISTENEITTAEKMADEMEAKKTAKEIKKGKTVRIKIPVDPQNLGDVVVPVMINGYMWRINRGETVDVPEQVAKILEEAKYI